MKRVLPLMLLSACGWGSPVMPELESKPQLVAVHAIDKISTGATLPSDILLRPEGGFAVLDSMRGHMLLYGKDGAPNGELSGKDWLRAVRGDLSADGKAWWLARPDDGTVAKVGPDGAILQVFKVLTIDGKGMAPVAVHDLGDSLMVGTRSGELLWLNSAGVTTKQVQSDVEGRTFGCIADLSPLADGGVAMVDTLGATIQILSADGTPTSFFGLRGPWIGHMMKPKAVTLGPENTLLVVDSYQGAAQLFDEDGSPLGALAVDNAILRFDHPIAVACADDICEVLDQTDGTVTRFGLKAEDIDVAREDAKVRHLRTPLVAARTEDAEGDQRLCIQCHDGIVNDDRDVWDKALAHHPVGVVPDLVTVPKGFPLDAAGKLRCGTCHSPHGVSDLDELAAADAGAPLIRHDSGAADRFTRAKRSDSSLCLACHTDAPHDAVVAKLGLPGAGVHPSGPKLVAALAKRGGKAGDLDLPIGVDGSCLSCHAVHGAAPGSLRREVADGGTCLGCHGDRSGTSNHPLPREPHADMEDGGREACFACHDIVGGRTDALLRFSKSGEGPCVGCHTNKVEGSPHARVQGDAGMACLGCHAPHGAPPPNYLTTLKVASDRDPSGCLTCHNKPTDSGAQPGVVGHHVNAKVACSDCHADPHQPQDVKACGSCHTVQAEAAARGGHGRAVCADCHPAHSPQPVLTHAPADLNPASRRCLACHAVGQPGDAPTVPSYEHPVPVFTPTGERWAPLSKLPLFGPNGQVVAAGQNGELVCQSCHLVHGPDPQRPGENLRQPNWQEACSACHADDALPLYRWFHAPQRRAGLLESP